MWFHPMMLQGSVTFLMFIAISSPYIDVPIINLIDSLGIKLTPLGSRLESIGIDAHVFVSSS